MWKHNLKCYIYTYIFVHICCEYREKQLSNSVAIREGMRLERILIFGFIQIYLIDKDLHGYSVFILINLDVYKYQWYHHHNQNNNHTHLMLGVFTTKKRRKKKKQGIFLFTTKKKKEKNWRCWRIFSLYTSLYFYIFIRVSMYYFCNKIQYIFIMSKNIYWLPTMLCASVKKSLISFFFFFCSS